MRGHVRDWRFARVLLLATVCALGLVVCMVAPERDPQLRAQAAQYVVLAESLTRGSYDLTSSPLAETVVTVPPLWPTILAAAYVAAAPESLSDFVAVAEAITIGLFVALIAMVFLFAEGRTGPLTAVSVASLCAVQPWLVAYARTAMPEIAFTLLLFGALRFGGLALRRRAAGSLYAALAFAVGAAFVRAGGIAVVLALAWRAWSVLPDRRRGLLAGVAASLLWPLRELVVTLLGTLTVTTTLENFAAALAGRGILAAVAENALFYANAFVAAVFPTDLLEWSSGQGILLLALWTLIVVGAVRDRIHDRGLAAATGALMLAGLLLWPSPGVRQFVPLLPLGLYFSARGLRRLVQLLARTFGFWHLRLVRLAPLLLMVLLLPYVRWTLGEADAGGRSPLSRGWQGFVRTMAWVQARAPRNAIVVTDYPDDVFVRTGRRAIPFNRALRHSDEKALNGVSLWLVRDASGSEATGLPEPGEISRAGGRIRYVENGSGLEVWLLPRRALKQLELIKEGSTRA